MACLFKSTANDSLEALSQSLFVNVSSILTFLLFQEKVEPGRENFRSIVSVSVQVKMHDGVAVPILLQFAHSQPIEEFLLPAEICLQRGEKEGLAEPTGTGEEIIAAFRHQLIHQRRLVHVGEAVTTQFLKILYSDGIFHTGLACGLLSVAPLLISDVLVRGAKFDIIIYLNK